MSNQTDVVGEERTEEQEDKPSIDVYVQVTLDSENRLGVKTNVDQEEAVNLLMAVIRELTREEDEEEVTTEEE